MGISDSKGSRSLFTLAENLGPSLKDFIPDVKSGELSQKLVWAGDLFGLSAHGFVMFQVILAFLGVLLGLTLSIFGIPLIFALILGLIMFVFPRLVLNEKIEKRKDAIQKALPQMVSLLAGAIKAGVDLSPALDALSYNFPGALGDELKLTRKEIATGTSSAKALKKMANRTGVEILERFVETINTAQERGGSTLSEVLDEFVLTVTEAQRRRAQEKARKIPTKMLLPIVLCIFLPMLLLMLAPVAIMMINNL